jgi:hypothetical protein
VTVVPPLHRWSDIVYLQWLLTSPTITSPAPIKYIFRLTIHHVPTYAILNKILKKHNRTQYELWPGMTFAIDSEEGKAILGTPNGAGAAW